MMYYTVHRVWHVKCSFLKCEMCIILFWSQSAITIMLPKQESFSKNDTDKEIYKLLPYTACFLCCIEKLSPPHSPCVEDAKEEWTILTDDMDSNNMPPVFAAVQSPPPLPPNSSAALAKSGQKTGGKFASTFKFLKAKSRTPSDSKEGGLKKQNSRSGSLSCAKCKQVSLYESVHVAQFVTHVDMHIYLLTLIVWLTICLFVNLDVRHINL